MADYLRDKELEQLVTANQELLIQLQRKLAAQRIATVITTESEEHRAMGRFMLLCQVSDLDRAKEYFGDEWGQSVEAEGLEVTELSAEACPACSSLVPPDVEECPECGLFVGRLEE